MRIVDCYFAGHPVIRQEKLSQPVLQPARTDRVADVQGVLRERPARLIEKTPIPVHDGKPRKAAVAMHGRPPGRERDMGGTYRIAGEAPDPHVWAKRAVELVEIVEGITSHGHHCGVFAGEIQPGLRQKLPVVVARGGRLPERLEQRQARARINALGGVREELDRLAPAVDVEVTPFHILGELSALARIGQMGRGEIGKRSVCGLVPSIEFGNRPIFSLHPYAIFRNILRLFIRLIGRKSFHEVRFVADAITENADATGTAGDLFGVGCAFGPPPFRIDRSIGRSVVRPVKLTGIIPCVSTEEASSTTHAVGHRRNGEIRPPVLRYRKQLMPDSNLLKLSINQRKAVAAAAAALPPDANHEIIVKAAGIAIACV